MVSSAEQNLHLSELYVEFNQYLSHLLGDLCHQELHIACACSGGADSLLLTLFTQKWLAQSTNKKIKHQLHVLIVDHQLRSEATLETLQTVELLKQYHMDATILSEAISKKPTQNIQNWARDYRYGLMEDYCLQNDILFLLVGHHNDDRLEGFWLNLMRGSGVYGLASMEAERNLHHVKIARPLLNVDASDIRQLLDEQQIGYICDSSNDSMKFTRNRIRKAQESLQAMGFDSKKIKQTALHLQATKHLLQQEMLCLKAQYCLYHPLGFIRMESSLFQNWHDDAYQSLLLKILADGIAMLGKKYPPRYQKLLQIQKKLQTPEHIRGVHIAGVNLWFHDNALFLFPAGALESSFAKIKDDWQLGILGDAGIKQWRAMPISRDNDLMRLPAWQVMKQKFPRALIKKFPAWFADGQLKAVPFFGCMADK